MKVMFATPCYISAVGDALRHQHLRADLHATVTGFGLQCILHMHSESLITRSRNKMVLKFLVRREHSLICSGSISDIAFTPQAVCRLLR